MGFIRKLLTGKDAVIYRPAGHNAQRLASGAEIIDTLRVCAVYDKPYIVRYRKRGPSAAASAQVSPASNLLPGRVPEYDYLGAVRVTPASNGPSAAVNPPVSLSVYLLPYWEERCPWCRTEGEHIVHCGYCGSIVCGGRTKQRREYFRCRKSCVGKGYLQHRGFDVSGSQSTPEKSMPQQAVPQGNELTLPVNSGRTALPANSNTRALPVQSGRKLLK